MEVEKSKGEERATYKLSSESKQYVAQVNFFALHVHLQLGNTFCLA